MIYEDIANLLKYTNMAYANELIPFILHYEGGYVNNPNDKGGATNKGITIATYRAYYGRTKTINDLKNLTMTEWKHIFKTGYWDKCRGDDIRDQSIANMLVDFAWHSGVVTAVKKIQKIVGVTCDGICGTQTILAINSRPPMRTFSELQSARLKYLQDIVKRNPKQKEHIKGWTKRVNAIRHGKLYIL